MIGNSEADNEGLEWIYLGCPHCDTHSRFLAQNTIIVEDEYAPGEKNRDFHTLATCEHCEDVVYVRCSDIDIDPDWAFFYHYHHPSSPGPTRSNEVPCEVFDAISEAHRCWQAGAFLATLVMCRRTVETLFHDRGVPASTSLQKSIEAARAKKLFETSNLDLADLLRLLGNAGAHQSSKASFLSDKSSASKAARDAYKLTSDLVAQVYVVPAKVKEMHRKLSQGDSGGN